MPHPKKIALACALALAATTVLAQGHVIKDIRLEGISRTEAGTVFSHLPIRVGDTYSPELGAESLRSLYASGMFQDVFLNAVGGIKISETASDLAVLIAIVSSMTNQAVSSKTAIFGEVGLGGEIRPVSRGQERIKEASKLGFTRIIVPLKNKAADIPGVEIIGVDNLRDAVKVVFGSNRVNHDEQVYPDE